MVLLMGLSVGVVQNATRHFILTHAHTLQERKRERREKRDERQRDERHTKREKSYSVSRDLDFVLKNRC